MIENYCTTADCRWHTERKGGRFVFINYKPYCEECAGNATVFNSGKNLWDFETTNMSKVPGQKIKVKSLNHLRQLEKQHGVVSVAANYDARRFEHPPQSPIGLRHKRTFQ